MVELQIVILAVAGSSPVGHPTFSIFSTPSTARNYSVTESLAGLRFSGIQAARFDPILPRMTPFDPKKCG